MKRLKLLFALSCLLIAGSASAQTNQVDNWMLATKASETHPNRYGFNCAVAVSTATTLTAVGGSCAAPGAGLSLYITDVKFGSSVASSTAADSFPTLKSGTGGTCGTGTAVIWEAMSAANTTVVDNMVTPIKVAANSEVCFIHSGSGSKTIQIHGFVAP